ncbi:MAG: potassium/proton antiporter [Butyribacter sp.]|nr:potassium/proton antiporter [bacterium]MDY3853842.1 potassium/proton antiporter [Butyribacter sp.]
MGIGIIIVATVIFLCILADKFSGKFGMPALLLFMFIGMLFGSDGILKIPFDDFKAAERICSFALLFIMFYGGFNTKWKLAKSVAVKSILLSTAGVAVTAGITAVLCHLFLHFSIAESFLVGAVLSSTDAASVFSILRKKKLNLKDGTASLLEIESGSNDPVSYMLTSIGIGLVGSGGSENVALQIFTQVVFGILVGVGFAFLVIWILTKTSVIAEGLDTIFMISAVLFCFGIADMLNGNVYLSVYLMGIIIGNSKIKNKNILVPFFDGITSLAQILLFFLLGLLAFPHKIPSVIVPSIAIVIFLTLIARPVAVFGILLPFRCSVRQCLLVSWAGLRGAASIVFAIMVVAGKADISYDLYHIVFLAALFSVAIQGTLLPFVAKKTGMVDESDDVRKTFNDYQEESAITMMRMYIPKGHNWENRKVKDVSMPTGSLALMIKRGEETMIPKGDTQILAGDNIILSVPAYEPSDNEDLEEIVIDKEHEWCNKPIEALELSDDELIAMIIRGEENLIPDGKTMIYEGDIVVTYR